MQTPASMSESTPLNGPRFSTERPTGKYCVAVEALSNDLRRCVIWRNDLVLATGRGATEDDAWREAHRNARMARYCGL